MTGVEIQYLIGLFVAISQLSDKKPYIKNPVKLLAGLILILLAVLKIALIV